MQALFIALGSCAVLCACSAPQMAQDAVPAQVTTEPADPDDTAPSVPATPTVTPDAPDELGEETTSPSGPSACPAGMQLIDGDYCPEVEHTYKRQWYAKANKKVSVA